MPRLKCRKCDHLHPDPDFTLEDPCVFHDPDNKVSRKLRVQRGLPDGCPGCLENGTIERKPYGRRKREVNGVQVHADWKLTCTNCGLEAFWSER